MLKFFSLLLILDFLMLVSCNSHNQDTEALEAKIDRLQHQLDSAYKPGLGEFMLGIQVHHAKLWFAGTSQNWKLADFELGEINETLDDIRSYCKDRPEISSLPMIQPALDSLGMATKVGNLPAFKNAFTLLTVSCNNCHHVTKHEFNVIKTPDAPPYSNQVFIKQP